MNLCLIRPIITLSDNNIGKGLYCLFNIFVCLFRSFVSWSAGSQHCRPCVRSTPRSFRPSNSCTRKPSTSSSPRCTRNYLTPTQTPAWLCPSDCRSKLPPTQKGRVPHWTEQQQQRLQCYRRGNHTRQLKSPPPSLVSDREVRINLPETHSSPTTPGMSSTYPVPFTATVWRMYIRHVPSHKLSWGGVRGFFSFADWPEMYRLNKSRNKFKPSIFKKKHG